MQPLCSLTLPSARFAQLAQKICSSSQRTWLAKIEMSAMRSHGTQLAKQERRLAASVPCFLTAFALAGAPVAFLICHYRFIVAVNNRQASRDGIARE
jgi:hypothetical protein